MLLITTTIKTKRKMKNNMGQQIDEAVYEWFYSQRTKNIHVLSSTDYPQLYSMVSELESKLIDIYFEKKTSKQSSIYDYFSKK